MGKTLLLIAALSLAGCGTLYTESDDYVTIHMGAGGLVSSTSKTYKKIAATGKPVIIDGQVVSGDAFFAFSMPGACYTENAVFSPHSASIFGLIPDWEYTEKLTRKLPPKLQDWFRGNVAYYDWIGFAEVDYAQLLEIWPEGACRDGRHLAEGGRDGRREPARAATMASQTAS